MNRNKIKKILNSYLLTDTEEETIEKIITLFTEPDDDSIKGDVYILAELVHTLIRPSRASKGKVYINTQARRNITARLKQYSLDELKTAIIKFSHNKWRMENNRTKSLDWFFRSEAQIETFQGLDEDLTPQNQGFIIEGKTYTLKELEEAEKKGEIVYDESNNKFIKNRRKDKNA